MDITTKDFNMLKKVLTYYEVLLSEYDMYVEPPVSIVILVGFYGLLVWSFLNSAIIGF